MSTYETIEIEDRGAARIIRVNRPKALNAINPTVIAELTRALEALSEQIEGGDWSVRGLIVTGAGDKAFVAGADIKEFAGRSGYDQFNVTKGFGIFEAPEKSPKPGMMPSLTSGCPSRAVSAA